jgi:hypothetical protein
LAQGGGAVRFEKKGNKRGRSKIQLACPTGSRWFRLGAPHNGHRPPRGPLASHPIIGRLNGWSLARTRGDDSGHAVDQRAALHAVRSKPAAGQKVGQRQGNRLSGSFGPNDTNDYRPIIAAVRDGLLLRGGVRETWACLGVIARQSEERIAEIDGNRRPCRRIRRPQELFKRFNDLFGLAERGLGAFRGVAFPHGVDNDLLSGMCTP